jgi:hypothetical protein
MKLEYIGAKPQKTDNVTSSAVVWNGAGDVQDIPDKDVEKFLVHPTVWRVADVRAAAAPEQPANTDAPKESAAEDEGSDVDDIKPLRIQIKNLGGSYDRRWKEDRLREEIAKLIGQA